LSNGKTVTIRAGRYRVPVSNPDKPLFPADGITKLDLAEYYAGIAPHILRHLRGRPLTVERYPDGIDKEGFVQKRVTGNAPEWVTTASVQSQQGSLDQVVCDKAATLVFLADQAAIALHPWLSRHDRPDHPDQLIFDLDPPGDDFEPVRAGAFALRELLDELRLSAFVKTSGSRGLHVLVPLDRKADFDTVRAFAGDVASVLVTRQPERFTTEVRKDARNGRLFVDTLRNAYAQTAVAPYSVRARPGAPVATPLDWDELADERIRSDSFRIGDMRERLEQRGDPWWHISRRGHSLKPARKRLDRMKA
jgi:bifunctional non-homologous end joining protein LigD